VSRHEVIADQEGDGMSDVVGPSHATDRSLGGVKHVQVGRDRPALWVCLHSR